MRRTALSDGRRNGEGRRPAALQLRRFAEDESGAMAAMYALALFVLVGMAGVAWDWTRLVALDSELQAAADQAALAAATQLDGQDGAIDRATAAANGLVANRTRMSNDGAAAGMALEVDSVLFYDGYDQEADTFIDDDPDEESTDASAHVVTVIIKPRDAVYVMTPIVAAFRADDLPGRATASLGSAICNTPPVMICNPMEDDDEDFDPADYIGHGLKLITDDAGAPGNFGFLRNGLGTGAQDLAKALGYDVQPGECVPSTGVTTEPGLKDVVFNALNTRFDIDINGANTCPGGGANCTAAPNVRKDQVNKTYDPLASQANKIGPSGCSVSNSNWTDAAVADRYRPTSRSPLTATQRAAVKIMGLPRDLCHAWSQSGDCASDPDASFDQYGIIGSSNWDRDAYFKANFGWDPTGTTSWTTMSGLDSDATRYDVYKWEVERTLSAAEKYRLSDGGYSSAVPICRATGGAERRLITAAVINCAAEGVAGHKENVTVAHWVELFLVEPSVTRKVAGPSSATLTDSNDVYVEVVRSVDVGGDASEGDVVRRDVPYLIR